MYLSKQSAQAVSIGRGALANPWIFRQLAQWEQSGTYSPPGNFQERMQLLKRQFRHLEQRRFNERGGRLTQHDIREFKDHSHNARRDCYLTYYIWMPQRILPGRYTLQLSFDDRLSGKTGQSTIEFQIVE